VTAASIVIGAVPSQIPAMPAHRFTARPEFARHAEGVGEFMSVPIDLPELVASVGRLLHPDC
jgi:hypothetical protein